MLVRSLLVRRNYQQAEEEVTMGAEKTSGKKKTGRRPSRIPTQSEIQLRLKKNAQAKRVLARIAKDLEKTRKDIEKTRRNLVGVVGPAGGSTEVALLDTLGQIIGICIGILIHGPNWVTVCGALYDAMSSIKGALDTPGLSDGERERLHKDLSDTIDALSRNDCP
jgi:hypothetical protein